MIYRPLGGEETLSADVVRVWYLQQKPRRDGTTFSFVGVYLPDWGTSRTLYPDMTQRAWLSVKVPEGAAPGLYAGQVTFAADDVEPTVLSVRLEVRPFSLKRPPHACASGGRFKESARCATRSLIRTGRSGERGASCPARPSPPARALAPLDAALLARW